MRDLVAFVALLMASFPAVAQISTVFDFEGVMPTTSGASGPGIASLSLENDGVVLQITREQSALFDVALDDNIGDGTLLPPFFGSTTLTGFVNSSQGTAFLFVFDAPIANISIDFGNSGLPSSSQSSDTVLLEGFAALDFGSPADQAQVITDGVGDGNFDGGSISLEGSFSAFRLSSVSSNGFFNNLFIDNIAITTVPGVGTSGVLAIGGLTSARRRR